MTYLLFWILIPVLFVPSIRMEYSNQDDPYCKERGHIWRLTHTGLSDSGDYFCKVKTEGYTYIVRTSLDFNRSLLTTYKKYVNVYRCNRCDIEMHEDPIISKEIIDCSMGHNWDNDLSNLSWDTKENYCPIYDWDLYVIKARMSYDSSKYIYIGDDGEKELRKAVIDLPNKSITITPKFVGDRTCSQCFLTELFFKNDTTIVWERK